MLYEPPYTVCPDFYREDSYVRWCESLYLLVFASVAGGLGTRLAVGFLQIINLKQI